MSETKASDDLAISSPDEPRLAGWADLAQAFCVVDGAASSRIVAAIRARGPGWVT